MISELLLRTAGLCFGAIAITAIAAWLGLAAWSVLSSRRLAARRPPALTSLAGALHGGDREAALAALAALSREQRIATLAEMAFTVAGDQRRRLDRIARDAGILDHAGRWARSRRWHRRLRAARLIALFGDGSEAAERLLGDPNPDVRAQAAEWAGAHLTRARATRLVEMLGDESAGCRFRAEEALAGAGREAIPSLVAALSRPPGKGTIPALRTARRVAAPDLLAPAVALTGDPDPGVRTAAAGLAAAVGGAASGELLDRLLGDPEPSVRRAAARGLGHLARWRSAAAVDRLLDDPRWRVRHDAGLALRRMGPTGELLLRRRAEGDDRAGVASARSALGLEPADEHADGEVVA